MRRLFKHQLNPRKHYQDVVVNYNASCFFLCTVGIVVKIEAPRYSLYNYYAIALWRICLLVIYVVYYFVIVIIPNISSRTGLVKKIKYIKLSCVISSWDVLMTYDVKMEISKSLCARALNTLTVVPRSYLGIRVMVSVIKRVWIYQGFSWFFRLLNLIPSKFLFMQLHFSLINLIYFHLHTVHC